MPIIFIIFILTGILLFIFGILRHTSAKIQKTEEPIEHKEQQYTGPTLDMMVGHSAFITYLRTTIRNCKKTSSKLPHMLFYGTSGTGKTALASAIANELGVECYFITGTQLSNKREILRLIESLSVGDVVIVDEIHRLREMHATMIYSILQDNNYAVEGDLIEVPEVTFIGVTTHEGLLPQALRNRFILKLGFRPYSDEEIYKIISNNYKFPSKIIELITSISFGIARDALSFSKALSSSAISEEEVSENDYTIVLDLLGYDKTGLSFYEKDTIKYIKDNNNMPVGVATLASAINVEKVTIEQRIKPRLLQLGIAKTNGTRGLNLTPKGLRK